MSGIWRAAAKRPIVWQLIGFAMVAAAGLVVWRLSNSQYALGFVTGVLIGGGVGIRLSRPGGSGSSEEGGEGG